MVFHVITMEVGQLDILQYDTSRLGEDERLMVHQAPAPQLPGCFHTRLGVSAATVLGVDFASY